SYVTTSVVFLPLSLHDALPILFGHPLDQPAIGVEIAGVHPVVDDPDRKKQRARNDAVADHLEDGALHAIDRAGKDAHGHEPHMGDRKSTRLNSSHVKISYAGFC